MTSSLVFATPKATSIYNKRSVALRVHAIMMSTHPDYHGRRYVVMYVTYGASCRSSAYACRATDAIRFSNGKKIGIYIWKLLDFLCAGREGGSARNAYKMIRKAN